MSLKITGAIALQIACTAALQMASLGSSFAAGPGIPAGGNYAHLLAVKLGATLNDRSVSGSTLRGISSQLARVQRDTDIITITSGGNDLGYVAGLMADSSGKSALPKVTSRVSEKELTVRFNKALADIHTKAPKAKVYLVEYLTMLGPNIKPGVNIPFSLARAEHHQGVAATLQRATAAAAEGKAWVERVPVAKESRAHGVGSAEPWVNGNKRGKEGGVAWHPNAAGMRAITDMLYDRIKGKALKTQSA